MNGNDEPEWLLPIDLMVDSYAPEQISAELGRRHGLYLREAQRLVLDGLAPDESGLATGIRAETGRYLSLQPWLAHVSLQPATATVEGSTLEALKAIVAAAPPSAAPAPAPPSSRPVRRLMLQPSATVVANMTVRKTPGGPGVELLWETAPNVTAWTIRVSVRPDPRQDYTEGEIVTLPAATTSYEVSLDDLPRRIAIYGLARDGRIVRRAVISALTIGNSSAQWKHQATAG
ncbi:MAG: hypothetical protein WCJ67_01635 [Thermoleophilia bacterium]